MDAATLMAMGGWRSWGGMRAYVGLKRETIEADYRDAIKMVASYLVPRGQDGIEALFV